MQLANENLQSARSRRLSRCSRYRCVTYSYRLLNSDCCSLLAPRASRLRRGMTLIELLVVIIIMTTVVAAAIPLLSPSNDDRRTREAARGLNTYITGAQSRAIALNRPVGVALKRLSHDTNRREDDSACLEVPY